MYLLWKDDTGGFRFLLFFFLVMFGLIWEGGESEMRAAPSGRMYAERAECLFEMLVV